MQKMHKLILLALVALASLCYGFERVPLGEMEGLQFEEIGDLKLIVKYETLVFNINIKTIEELIKNQTENLEILKEFFQNDTERLSETEKLITELELRKLELEDALFGLIVQKNPDYNRKKRGVLDGIFSGGLTSEDGRKIELDLKALKDTINSVIDVNGGLKNYLTNTINNLNATQEEIGKLSTYNRAVVVNSHVERKVNAIIKLVTKERLNGEIITIAEFNDTISKILKNLTEGEELPYAKSAEYYYHVRVTHSVQDGIITLKMDIPIVETSSRKLYKTIEIPVRDGHKLILVDAEWKFIAVNDNETTTLMSLDLCYKAKNSTFFCDLQSPLKHTSDSQRDCVTNALVEKKIDMKLCKASIVESPQLTFIRINDGQYFYYTPTNETLNITCRAKTENYELRSDEIGILKLESGCRAVTKRYTLMRTDRNQQDPFMKKSLLSVTFDIEEVKENIKKYNTPIVSKFYIDSLNSFREMHIPDTPKIDKLHFTASFAQNEIFQYFLVIMLLIFIVHLMYRTYMWFLTKCKCLQLEKSKSEQCKKPGYEI